ncbi:hypothetical protein F5887DRAFT_981753 [Amanita rubescens]|nr:hypothetical protein F5887DRAFT_981753 [Amanita rubescens]
MSSTFPPTPPPTPPSSGTSFPSSTPTDNGENNSLTSSASLYLYTFLATLVLLLVVSAAIVVRSFILRRRHRMMIEEAFRNGTLLSPTIAAGYGLRPRVDLSKKPKMWDAWIEKSEQPTSGRSREKEWYWDMMKPFSAVYTLPPGGNVPGNNDDRGISNRQGILTPRRSLRVRMGTAARALAYYVSTRPSMNSHNGSSPPSSTQLALPTVLSHLDSGNATVKVAVLIAMPRKPSMKDSSSSASFHPSSPSSSTSPSSQPLFSPPMGGTGNDDDEQLPHLEVGITEVRVVSNSDDSASQGKGIMQE